MNTPPPLLHRLPLAAAETITFELDGQPCTGRAGDSVLTAVLAQGVRLRRSEASASPRAGLCLMGACQDCWMDSVDGTRLRACSTPLQPGMRLLTERPA